MDLEYNRWLTKVKRTAIKFRDIQTTVGKAYCVPIYPDGIEMEYCDDMSTRLRSIEILPGWSVTRGGTTVSLSYYIPLGEDNVLAIRNGVALYSVGNAVLGDSLDILCKKGLLQEDTPIYFDATHILTMTLPPYNEQISKYFSDLVDQYILTDTSAAHGYIIFCPGAWADRIQHIIDRNGELFTLRLAETHDDWNFVQRLNREVGVNRLCFYDIPAGCNILDIKYSTVSLIVSQLITLQEEEVKKRRSAIYAERLAYNATTCYNV